MIDRTRLVELTRDFTEAFNRNDLAAVMSYFSDDAVYDEFNGTRSRGIAAIRAAFEPQFRGDYGSIRFEMEDIVADAEGAKTLVRWLCVAEKSGKRRAWRGLDVLEFAGDRIRHKSTYAKAPAPSFE